MSARDKVMQAIRDFHFWNYGLDDVDPNSEYAEWVPALADAICAAIDGEPFHIIEFREDGWTLKHPLDCRDKLFECAYNRTAETLSGPPTALGRYRVSLNGNALVVGEALAPMPGEPTYEEIAATKREEDR